MAPLTFVREGDVLISRTPKVIGTVTAPAVDAIYDQCNVLTGFAFRGSYAIAGRLNCFDPVVDIQRVSFRANYALGNFGIPGLGEELVPTGLFVPNPPGFLKIREFFNGNPALPVERLVSGSNSPLRDVCKVVIGTKEKKTVQRYGFTAECQSITRYGFSSTVARHSSITDANISDTITALMTGMYLTEQASGVLATIDAALNDAWAAKAGVVIDVPLGAFE